MLEAFLRRRRQTTKIARCARGCCVRLSRPAASRPAQHGGSYKHSWAQLEYINIVYIPNVILLSKLLVHGCTAHAHINPKPTDACRGCSQFGGRTDCGTAIFTFGSCCKPTMQIVASVLHDMESTVQIYFHLFTIISLSLSL